MSDKERVTHFEVSDGDTLIVACRACPLEVSEVSEDLVVEDQPCCVNGNNKCDDFYKMWTDSGDGKTWIQCAGLTIYNGEDSRTAPKPLDVTPVKQTCPKCDTMLTPSTIEGYTWQCLECDEDFMEIEVNQNEQ